MKIRTVFLLFVFMFFALGHGLSASGKKQAAEAKPTINPEWTMIITAFDASAMSPAWQTAGDTVTRNLASALRNVNFRIRGEEESAFHRNIAWARSRNDAAIAVVRKRNERDQLIFRGDPVHRYERALKNVEEEILKLEEAFVNVDDNLPEVEPRPAFNLHRRNRDGVFPPPPEPGEEIKFCADYGVDAFLTGRLSEFRGRVFLEMSLYTRYSESFSFDDHVLFSSEDFEIVLGEISERVVAAVSGLYPSTILVHATPPEAMILVDGTFIGRGAVERSHFPGEAQISVRAENFVSTSFPLVMEPGEIAEVFINLTPLGLNVFQVDTPERPGSRVFHGGLFVGETPLTLDLRRNELALITVETADGEIGSVVYRDNTIIGGSAEFVRSGGNHGRADFITALPATDEDRLAARARNSFYRAYGALWFALPVGMLAAGVANTYINANNAVVSGNLYLDDPAARDRISANASVANVFRYGAYGLIGAALGTTFYQIFRYIMSSRREATPVVRVIEPEPEPEEETESEEEPESDSDAEIEGEDEPEIEGEE